jgi:nucleoside-diphosphate-sugar epimerase
VADAVAVFVDDEIAGFLALMESDYVMPVNIGNPDEVSMRQLAEEIRELCGSRSEIVHTPLPPDDPKQRCPDISLAKRILGWEPWVSRREGLEKTIAFYRKKLEWQGVATLAYASDSNDPQRTPRTQRICKGRQ